MKKKYLERKRIADIENAKYEMQRNVRVELYTPDFIEKIEKSFNLSKLARYPDLSILTKKIAEFNNIQENQILITSGIDSGIKTAFEMLTEEKKSKAIYLTPTYAMYKVYADAFEVEMIAVESENSLSVNYKSILEKIDSNIDILFLPNPHIPIEHIFSTKEIEEILIKAEKHNVIVFVDEAYFMFGSETMISYIEKFENLIVARTFSKGFGLPAIRLGFLVANEKLISYLSSRRFAHETNFLSSEIAIWAMDNFNLFESYIKEIQESKEWIRNKLSELGFNVFGEKTNTLLIDFSSSEKAKNFAKLLRSDGFIVKSNIQKPFDKYILFTIGKMETMELFYQAVQKYIKEIF